MDKVINYFRTFPDLLPKREKLNKIFESFRLQGKGYRDYLGGAFFIYFGVLVVVFSMLLFVLHQVYGGVLEERQRAEEKLSYWEEMMQKYPNSPKVYYNAAYYAGRIKDKKLAYLYIGQSLNLDGDFEKALLLREEIIKM